MDDELRLMAVLAHPDDESLAFGGALARYAAEGVRTSLLCATRGEVGWQGWPAANPGPAALGRLREAELRRAAAVLSLDEVVFLDYIDGEVGAADPVRATARIVAEVRRFRPDVVVTFGPDGNYGHPDHVAISQLTTAALACAGDPSYHDAAGFAPHRVAKLYYRICTAAEKTAYEAVFGAVTIDVDGERRRWISWPDWVVSARIDAGDHRATVWSAVSCHRSQIAWAGDLGRLRPDDHRRLWGAQHFYRAMGATGGGLAVEDDLFAGLRRTSARPLGLASAA